MASRYRRQASTIGRRTADRLRLWLVMTLSAVAALPAAALADDAAAVLKPYTAEYKTTARGFDLNVTRALEVDNNNHFILTNGGKILVVGFHEISVFRVEDARVMPISYIYQGIGLVSRRRELHFDPGKGAISSLYKDAWYELPYSDATLDRMNQVEQLRLMLMHDSDPANNITLRVADGKRVKDSRLVLVAEETLATPLGPVDTLHFSRLHESADRSSDIWFAPEWDYMMVKTVHVEDGDPVEMTLTSATIAGEPIGIQ